MKKVSVILTTYNSEKFLRRAIDSVLGQNETNVSFTIELLVIDDCSKDSTLQILEEYNIAYETTESNSGGPNRGRNIGLSKSTGDYIIIMDHDDEWQTDRVRRQLQYADRAPIITCSHSLISSDKDVMDLGKGYEFRYYEKNVTFKDIISKTKNRQSTYLGSIMFHKSLKSILFEEHFGQVDFDWRARLFHNNASVELGASLFNRYVYGENLSLARTYRIRDYEYSLRVINDFQKDYPSEVREGIKRINGTRARYHYLIGEMTSARKYFLKSHLNVKTFLFYLTSFVGHKYVRRKFHFFG